MKIKGIYQPYMLRPILYMTAYRTLVALIFFLLVERFVQTTAANMIAAFLAVAFALLSYLVYLRMDGLGIPRMKYIRPKKKADAMRNLTSMNDHIDDDPGVSFEELEDDEKNLCSLIANVVNLVLFLAASFVL